MPTGLIPVVIIAIGFVVQFFVQRNVLTRYDYQCGNCGAIFSPGAASTCVVPGAAGVVGRARAEGLAEGS